MSTIPKKTASKAYDYKIEYPTSDGRPMGETDLHRGIMFDLISSLEMYYRNQRVYVSGNLLIYYQPGNKRRHVSPDVFVVKDIDPHPREYYLLWEEGKGPDAVIEVTSRSTRKEDLRGKFELYRDVLKVREYFLFDPRGEYLKPALQGFRLENEQYVQINAEAGRLPSEQLGLQLERDGQELRLFDPNTGQCIPNLEEARAQAEAARAQAEAAREQAEAAYKKAESARQVEAAARLQLEQEIERLKKLRRRPKL